MTALTTNKKRKRCKLYKVNFGKNRSQLGRSNPTPQQKALAKLMYIEACKKLEQTTTKEK